MFLACVGEDPGPADTSSGTSGTSGASGTSGTSGTSGASGTSGTSGTSDAEISVETNAACPAFTPCGGNPSGTYGYTAGCIDDLFSGLKSSCLKLDTSNVKVGVKGSLHFSAAGVLERDVVLTLTGSLTVPRACPVVGVQCNIAEAGLKQSFPNTKCTVVGDDCNCAFDQNDHDTSSTTFTIDGGTVTTADGQTYTMCQEGPKLKYEGRSAGSMDGTWELTKR